MESPLSKILREFRAETDLTQNDAAEAIGVAENTWRSWEKKTGASRPRQANYEGIARLMKISVKALQQMEARETFQGTLPADVKLLRSQVALDAEALRDFDLTTIPATHHKTVRYMRDDILDFSRCLERMVERFKELYDLYQEPDGNPGRGSVRAQPG